MPTHHFVWIQHSAQCVATSSFAFWNCLGYFFPNIFDSWLVKCADVKAVDTEGRLYTKI